MGRIVKILVFIAGFTLLSTVAPTSASILWFQSGLATHAGQFSLDNASVVLAVDEGPWLDRPGLEKVSGLNKAAPAPWRLEFPNAPFWPDAASLVAPGFRPHANAGNIVLGAPAAAPPVLSRLPVQRKTIVERISFGTPSLAPMAFIRFCLRYPRDCDAAPSASQTEPIALSDERKVELAMVNRNVNRSITPQANVNGVVTEEWLISPQAGDCNDYAVTKRHELLARGWPAHALLLSEVVIPSGEHHLVLVVRTPEGDLVLDNLHGAIRSVSQTRYRWVRAQQAGNPKFWSMVSVARTTQVAANAR